MKILLKAEQNDMLNKLKEDYGISDFNPIILKFGKEKYRFFTGKLGSHMLAELDEDLRIENIGLYLAREQDSRFRIAFDALHILKNKINKNIIEIDDNQAQEWMKGFSLSLNTEGNFKVIRYKNDWLGCGKNSDGKIQNNVPKERRLKSNAHL